jgi:hypothetical protein
MACEDSMVQEKRNVTCLVPKSAPPVRSLIRLRICVWVRRGQFYPGGAQFALELSRHNLPTGRAPNRLAVLTARAREFKVPSHPPMLEQPMLKSPCSRGYVA